MNGDGTRMSFVGNIHFQFPGMSTEEIQTVGLKRIGLCMWLCTRIHLCQVQTDIFDTDVVLGCHYSQ